MSNQVITKEIILHHFAYSTKWLERGILAIYARQTSDEKSEESTKHTNARGFSGCDAKRGSYYARWIQNGGTLTGEHLVKARKMMRKYAGQLVIVANEKAAARELVSC